MVNYAKMVDEFDCCLVNVCNVESEILPPAPCRAGRIPRLIPPAVTAVILSLVYFKFETYP